MQKLIYKVQFLTPAFLGNAEQTGQWRVPPFKALLRQWWRVAAARAHNYNHEDLRRHEGMLFGNAWLESNNGTVTHQKSRIALRLLDWKQGTLSSQRWPGGQMDTVNTTRDGRGKVRADVYLGFGPVLPPSKKENRLSIEIRQAIDAETESILEILPERIMKPSLQDIALVKDTLQLMAWFGTLGSRSRNGWGSLQIVTRDANMHLSQIPSPDDKLLKQCSREFAECMKLDWPHALGVSAGKPLIWITRQSYQNWRTVIGCLANIRVEIRSIAKSFFDRSGIGGIHFLGYPAGGKWALRELSKGFPHSSNPEGRLASQLRFKVIKTEDGLRGIVFHMPCRFPSELMNRLSSQQKQWIAENELKVWEKIHAQLNRSDRLNRWGV